MSSKRHLRLSEAYHKEIAEILLFKIRDPKVFDVHVTSVVFTPDLGLAKVYISMPDGRQREDEVIQGLERSKGYIKKEISSRVNIKHMPDLKFYYDESEEKKTRIDDLFDQIKKQKNETNEEY